MIKKGEQINKHFNWRPISMKDVKQEEQTYSDGDNGSHGLLSTNQQEPTYTDAGATSI